LFLSEALFSPKIHRMFDGRATFPLEKHKRSPKHLAVTGGTEKGERIGWGKERTQKGMGKREARKGN